MKQYLYLSAILFCLKSYSQPVNWKMLNGIQYVSNLFVKDNIAYTSGDYFGALSTININTGEFKNTNQFNSNLSDDFIYQILVDDISRTWIRHANSISIKQNNLIKNFPLSYFGINNNSISPLIGNIAFDKENNAWFLADNYLIKFDGINFTKITPSNFTLSNEIIIDNNDFIWLSSSNNLIKYDGLNWQVFYGDSIGITFPVSHLRNDRKDNIWFLEGGSRLKKFNSANTTLISPSNYFTYIEGFEIDTLDNIWATYYNFNDNNGYLLRLNGNKWDTLSTNFPRDKYGIMKIFPIETNDVFIGTTEGLFRLKNNSVIHYNVNDTFLLNGGVGKLFASVNSETVWITSSRGLMKWDGNKMNHFENIYSHFGETPNNEFYLDKRDSLWVSRANSFCRLEKWQNTFWDYNCITDSFYITQLAFDSQNGVWIKPGKIYKSIDSFSIIPLHYFNKDTTIFYPEISSAEVSLICDSKNTVWVLNNDSLGNYNNGNWYWYKVPKISTLFNMKPSLNIDFSDNIFINFGDVLLSFDGKIFSTIYVPDSLLLEKIVFLKDSSFYGMIANKLPYVSHYTNHLLHYKNGVWDSLQIPIYSDEQVIIRDFAIDKNGTVWFLTGSDLSYAYSKIFIYNPNGLNLYFYPRETIDTSESVIYPNPSDGNFSVNFYSSSFDNITLKIYDLNGLLIYEDKAKNCVLGNNTVNYSFDNVRSGIYFVFISTSHRKIIKKLYIM